MHTIDLQAPVAHSSKHNVDYVERLLEELWTYTFPSHVAASYTSEIRREIEASIAVFQAASARNKKRRINRVFINDRPPSLGRTRSAEIKMDQRSWAQVCKANPDIDPPALPVIVGCLDRHSPPMALWALALNGACAGIDADAHSRFAVERREAVYSGATGLIGRNAVYELLRRGWEFANLGGLAFLEAIVREAYRGPKPRVPELGSGPSHLHCRRSHLVARFMGRVHRRTAADLFCSELEPEEEGQCRTPRSGVSARS